MDSAETVVVGGGIAGFACARAIGALGLPVRVLDRGRAPGGRMASRTLHGRPVDLGASYLTVPDGSPFAPVVADWTARGLARPWTDTFATADADGLTGTTTGPLRYGTPGGLRSLVTDLATGVAVTTGRDVGAVTGAPAVDGEPAAAVVLALPDPQAARLVDAPTAGRLGLDPDGWEPVLAVALGFADRRWPADLHGVFVNDHPELAWLADDGDRRGDGAPVLVAHTTGALAARHLADPDAATGTVVDAVVRLLGLDAAPAWTHTHRWTYARPGTPREQPFGRDGRLGVCGDGWSAPPRVESAWRSGDALGRALAAELG
ncbi:NAD(P)-binding protein [Modestobacter sp. NPDC049651]|uniref:NAD(P)/FAD-dependent oxidoreductase n=1 Tax=unclassified Modestobacter TaxID=2643866 RepID=UPI00340F7CCA